MSVDQEIEFKENLARFQNLLYDNADFHSYKNTWEAMSDDNKKKILKWFYDNNPDSELNIDDITVPEQFITVLTSIKKQIRQISSSAGSRRRRRPSRKYKKSAKRVFRKKSRSTRRR